MYYTLIHNKDVAFLRGCRPSRLNHITLVFSVFRFYASPSASTLAYTTWYNTSMYRLFNISLSLYILNMVSEPNFVLGIKQTSLANKEDSHVHTTIRSHTCLSAGSRLHSISQPPWLTAVSRFSSPSNPCLSPSNLCTTSLRLMKPTRQTCSTAYHDQNPRTRPPTVAARATTRGQQLLELSHAPSQILDSQLRSQSHAPPRQPYRPPIYLA